MDFDPRDYDGRDRDDHRWGEDDSTPASLSPSCAVCILEIRCGGAVASSIGDSGRTPTPPVSLPVTTTPEADAQISQD
jgi:hypothetical protein